MQYHAILCNTMQYNAIQCNTLQYNAIPEELIFLIKSLVAKIRNEKRPVILQCWDISKFFDKEMIEDALLTCYKRDVNPKIVRLWAKLNENTTIKVKTGVGESERANVGAVVGQGTIGGALVSQAVLDEGVNGTVHVSRRLYSCFHRG